MADRTFRTLRIQPKDVPTDEIGTWLWALEDSHQMLFDAVEGISQETIDFTPFYGGNSIGTLLYHIAATDMSWLFKDILVVSFSNEVEKLLPYNSRNDEGMLFPVLEVTLREHISRLERTRRILIGYVEDMDKETFRRTRKSEHYEVSPEWILYHLAEHENYHRGQIKEIRKQAEAGQGV